MASNPLPQLPAFLTQPLECSSAHCHSPHLPLLSKRVSFAVNILLPEQWRLCLNVGWMNLTDRSATADVYQRDVEAKILALAAQNSLAGFVARTRDPTFIETIKAQAGRTFDATVDSKAMERHYADEFRAVILDFWLYTVGRNAARPFKAGESCLHDYV